MKVHNINSVESYLKLKKIKNSGLVDVRTSVEWKSTGIPDLSHINKSVLLIEWEQTINRSSINKFQEILISNFDKQCSLFFICKSGIRSKIAAELAIMLGYFNCYNIIDGFSNNKKINWKNMLPVMEFEY